MQSVEFVKQQEKDFHYVLVLVCFFFKHECNTYSKNNMNRFNLKKERIHIIGVLPEQIFLG